MNTIDRRSLFALLGIGVAARALGRAEEQSFPLRVTYYYLPG